MQTGQKIAKLRIQAELSQAQLADALFVSRELVSKWETGSNRPDRKMLEALAKLFSVPLNELIDIDAILSEELSSAVPEDYLLDPDVLKADLNAFLETLNERDRSVFIRRYYRLEEPFEIGEKYGIKENYVRTILMRVRKKLKKYLKEVRS
ncbi:MAG: helix-turn-helix domain-containing protein [Clostridia bacterium]|nr:helix-turn-helix domain-containing protein [Clostridia bacterium]